MRLRGYELREFGLREYGLRGMGLRDYKDSRGGLLGVKYLKAKRL
jgi:hypothetical protein